DSCAIRCRAGEGGFKTWAWKGSQNRPVIDAENPGSMCDTPQSSALKGVKIGQVAKSRRHSRQPHDLSAAWANWRCWRTLAPGRRIIRRGPIHALERATKWHRPGR